MAEYIEREDTLRQMRNSKADKPPYGNWDIAHDCCIDIAKNIPTADVVEVVRCKNCEYAEANGGDCNSTLPITYRNYICEVNETKYITLEHCSYGKKKEGAEE